MAREPNRSTRTPTGICSAAYTSSCSTVKKEISAALAWKRSVASRPTTPNEVRWLTATRYAKIPTIQISQARGEVTPHYAR